MYDFGRVLSHIHLETAHFVLSCCAASLAKTDDVAPQLAMRVFRQTHAYCTWLIKDYIKILYLVSNALKFPSEVHIASKCFTVLYLGSVAREFPSEVPIVSKCLTVMRTTLMGIRI